MFQTETTNEGSLKMYETYGKDLLWNPDIQRIKTSQYGGKSLRYEPKLKRVLINEFKELHNKTIP